VTDIIKAALIASAPPTMMALAALVKVFQIGFKVDGRLTELLELTRKSSHAEGVKAEKEHEKKARH
jgi:hypothetical protein